MADPKINVKLLVDKERNRVVFAECDKDFVDVLFSFLTLPLGTIIRLANKKSELGCADALYQSVESLDGDYFETEACKSMLLRPRSVVQNKYRNLVLNVDDSTDDNVTSYICPIWICCTETHCLTSYFEDATCLCGKKMVKSINLVKEPISEKDKLAGVFVKGTRKLLIRDDLRVQAVSPKASLAILVDLGYKDGSSLEERTVSAGMEEVLCLLKCCLLSKTPLTDMFLLQKHDTNKTIIKSEQLIIKSESSKQLSEGKKMNLDLIVWKSHNKVLYAESKQDFVSFLFSFLAFPLASVIKILGGYSSIGSVDNLYKSVEDLCNGNPDNFQVCKDKILDPKVACHHGCDNQVLQMKEEGSSISTLTKCSSCFGDGEVDCEHGLGEANLLCINPKYSDTIVESGKGFVKESEMFMVTDDLIMEPLSPISTVSLVNKLGIPFIDLEERTVSVGEHEALSLLKASLTSKTVLTNVFCRKN